MSFLLDLNESTQYQEGVYIALGGNLPFQRKVPLKTIKLALNAMPDYGFNVISISRPWRTPAWPDPAHPSYINGVVKVQTNLNAEHVLLALHDIEKRFGRVRERTNSPRTLDLDLIDYYGEVSAPDSTVITPHPRIAGRAFVLCPLKELAPNWVCPRTGRHIDQLIGEIAKADRKAARLAGGRFF